MEYHGLDWIAMASNFAAIALLSGKHRIGFLIFIVGNITWMIVADMAQSYAIFVGNLAFLFLNVRGFFQWGKAANTSVVGTAKS